MAAADLSAVAGGFPGRRLRWVVGVVVCGVLVFPVYRTAKAVRARGLAGEAERALEGGRWGEAAYKATAAHQMAPIDPRVLRVEGRISLAAGEARTLGIWKYLAEKEGTVADWDGYFRAALRLGDAAVAAKALEGFRKAAPGETGTALAMECRWLAAAGRSVEAEAVARQVLEHAGPEQGGWFYCAGMLLNSTMQEHRDRARDALWDAARTDQPEGLMAAMTLAQARGMDAGKAREVAERLRTHPLAGWEQKILATVVEVAHGAPEREAWQALAAGRLLEDRVKLARWLVNMGKHAMAAGMVTLEEARQDAGAALVHVDILGSQGRWAEVRDFVRMPECPLEEALKQVFSARAAHEEGQKELASSYWNLAVRTAGEDPRVLGYLANYAAVMGWEKEAQAICRQLAANPRPDVAERGRKGLAILARRRGETAEAPVPGVPVVPEEGVPMEELRELLRVP